jgi:hypothetical protein
MTQHRGQAEAGSSQPLCKSLKKAYGQTPRGPAFVAVADLDSYSAASSFEALLVASRIADIT